MGGSSTCRLARWSDSLAPQCNERSIGRKGLPASGESTDFPGVNGLGNRKVHEKSPPSAEANSGLGERRDPAHHVERVESKVERACRTPALGDTLVISEQTRPVGVVS